MLVFMNATDIKTEEQYKHARRITAIHIFNILLKLFVISIQLKNKKMDTASFNLYINTFIFFAT